MFSNRIDFDSKIDFNMKLELNLEFLSLNIIVNLKFIIQLTPGQGHGAWASLGSL